MKNEFLKQINELYNHVIGLGELSSKLNEIEDYKKQLGVNVQKMLGEVYFDEKEDSKENGVIYTPSEISQYITENTLSKQAIIDNPYVKIADPACGCGNLILPCFLKLQKLFTQNLNEINQNNDLNLSYEDIPCHIIDNNIFGFDIDIYAIKILLLDLFSISGYINQNNFFISDFLLDKTQMKFDIFIGNPPYVGHKSVTRQYSGLLKDRYKLIYKDKGDISYCFFESAIHKLNMGGRLSFITSRYFIESVSGTELRKMLKDNFDFIKIVDFYGIRPFKKARIDPIILFLKKELKEENIIEIIKPKKNVGKKKDIFCRALYENNEIDLKKFYIDKNDLNDSGWVLINEKERHLIKKIEQQCLFTLKDICDSYQGIITGCDKAFVVDSQTIKDENIETEFIKPWIKNSCVQKKRIIKKDSFIIYSDSINKIEDFPNIKNHIEKYKSKLMNRRECISGVRKWFQPQWGRDKNIFEGQKIVFPYKADSNRFALDTGSYFSADIYCLVLKEYAPFSNEDLLYLLNSKLYEFYFKTFAKKMGEDMYEYYPNTVMKLCIPYLVDFKETDEKFLYEFFGLDEEEIKIIENN